MSELKKREEARSVIAEFEAILREHPEAQMGDQDRCPLTHQFGGGMYVRQIFIPKGMVVVGKIHRHAHPNFLMSGEVLVVTEGGGREHLKAPLAMISPAGTKRVVYTITDCLWATVHITEETDLAKIEQQVIAPSYEALDAPESVKQIGGV